MMEKLHGWDLLTWRLGYEDKGIVPLVGAQITISGHIDFETLLTVIRGATRDQEILRISLSNEEFPTPRMLTEFNIRECVEVLHHQTNPAEFALRHASTELSPKRFREDLPLWRVYVVYREGDTLLFTFLHHAIADGRAALEIIFRICGEPSRVPKIQDERNTFGFGNLFQQFLANPFSVLQQATPALIGLSELAVLSPRHTLPNFANRSFRDKVIQYSLPRSALQEKARELSVSSHDISVAISLHVIYELERLINQIGSQPIRVNIPVALKQSTAFNQIAISRLLIPRLNFGETARTYRSLFQKWRSNPSMNLFYSATNAVSQVEQIDVTSFAMYSDITLSSLPSIAGSLRVAGNEVRSIWPLVPTMGSAFNTTTIGLKDTQYFTLTFDVGIQIDDVTLRRAIRTSVERNLEIVVNFQHQL